MEDILDFIKKEQRPLTQIELENKLKRDVHKDLKKLIDSGEIIKNNNKFGLNKDTMIKKGVITVKKKGFGFVKTDDGEEDLYINEKNINKAIDKDLVLVKIINKELNEGKVIKVLERNTTVLVGEVIQTELQNVYIKPDNLNLSFEIIAANNLNLVEGHKVQVKISKYLSTNIFYGEVLNVIGHKTDPMVDIISVAYDYGFELERSKEVEEEVNALSNVVKSEELEGRIDLSKDKTFTIDGKDTKDIDDAISILKTEDKYILRISIADVSHYVRPKTPLDESAYKRATSVYLTNYVFPMLPHAISNGICSLNENELRLAMTAEIHFDFNGNVLDRKIYPSYIISKKKMNYTDVNRFFHGEEIKEYENFYDELNWSYELSTLLSKIKEKRGYINFYSNEAKILVDDEGKPYDIKRVETGVGEKIIEDFMIAANEAVAETIYELDKPFIYRVHEKPIKEKVDNFKKFTQYLGIQTPKIKGDDIKPKDIQVLLDSLREEESFPIFSSLLLRTMQKAIYSPDNMGHFGLASTCYTHFTAPIRRYPDLMVHRMLKDYLFKKNNKNYQKILPEITQHSSDQERKAIDCEREVNDMKMAEYMEDHIGRSFEGTIVSITNFGLFVQLDNLIEGMVSVKTLNGYYKYIEENQTITSEKITYKLGQRVKIKVAGASKETRNIDFIFEDNYNDNRK